MEGSEMPDQKKVKEMDFQDLILGFSSAALYYIGHPSIEGKGVGEENPQLAKQNLQILELLKTKTKGNLTSEEDSLLCSVILDLQTKIL